MTTLAQPWQEDLETAPALGQWALVWRRFRRHSMALLGLAVLAMIGLVPALAPWIAPYPFDAIDLNNIFIGPTAEHWLGTDELGRDTLTRLLYAGRMSLFVAVLATFFSVVIGPALGAIAAWTRGVVDMGL